MQNIDGKEWGKLSDYLLVMLALHSSYFLMRGAAIDNGDGYKSIFYSIIIACIGFVIIYFLHPIIDRVLKTFVRISNQIGWSELDMKLQVYGVLYMLIISSIFAYLLYAQKPWTDGHSFHWAVYFYLENGWEYFFSHYNEIPWLGRQHPPLPIIFTGELSKLSGLSIFTTLRLLSVLFGIGIAVCTFMIAQKLYSIKIALLSVIFLFEIRYFYLFNILTSNDIYVSFFLVLTVLLLIKLSESADRISRNGLVLSFFVCIGLTLGLLSKYTMVLIFPFIFALVLWPFGKLIFKPSLQVDSYINYQSRFFYLFLIFAFPLVLILPWIIFSSNTGVFQKQISQIIQYMGSNVVANEGLIIIKDNFYFEPWRIKMMFLSWIVYLPSSIGLYNLPIIGFGLLHFLFYSKSNSRFWNHKIILFWLLAVALPVLVLLPINRYLMPAYPALAILMAIGAYRIFQDKALVLGCFGLFLSITSAYIYL